MIACPVNVILIDDVDKRYPIIYPESDPCIQCETHPCIQSCPTGALNEGNGFELVLLT
jgi:formate hydrogenlyase subunit 6/NADH:ubiquinone oxidoreductase subunit I